MLTISRFQPFGHLFKYNWQRLQWMGMETGYLFTMYQVQVVAVGGGPGACCRSPENRSVIPVEQGIHGEIVLDHRY